MKGIALTLITLALSACVQTQGGANANATPLTLPSPTRFISIPRPSATMTSTMPPTATDTPSPEATSSATASATSTETVIATRRPSAQSETVFTLARSAVSTALEEALRAASVDDPQVYWFTFAKGDGEEALMIQYASPIRFRPGYEEMLQAAKRIAAENFMKIDPPLFTLFIAATDLTGTSDVVVRLRRPMVEQWTSGEIGTDELFNNGFEQAAIVVTCEQSGTCSAINATPFPKFPPFPFPFPTPTP